MAREEAEGLDKESLAAEARVSAMKNNPVDGVANERTTLNIMAPAAKALADMSQVDEGDGAGTPLTDKEAPYGYRPEFASCGR